MVFCKFQVPSEMGVDRRDVTLLEELGALPQHLAADPGTRGLHMARIQAVKRLLSVEAVHVDPNVAVKVSLADLDHDLHGGEAAPGSTEQLSGQRIQRDVNAQTLGGFHHVSDEVVAMGIENLLAGEAKGFHEVLHLLFIVDRGKDLGSDHQGELNDANTDGTTGGMDEDGLILFQAAEMQQGIDYRDEDSSHASAPKLKAAMMPSASFFRVTYSRKYAARMASFLLRLLAVYATATSPLE